MLKNSTLFAIIHAQTPQRSRFYPNSGQIFACSWISLETRRKWKKCQHKFPSHWNLFFSLFSQSLWCFSEANSRHDWRRWAVRKVPAKAEDYQGQFNGGRSNGWQKVSRVPKVSCTVTSNFVAVPQKRTVTAISAWKTNKDWLRTKRWVKMIIVPCKSEALWVD